jgi:hypothetical protein
LNVLPPVYLDFLGVFILVVEARVERLGLPGGLQIFGQLPVLEDRLDLSDERRDLGPEVGVGLGGFEEVQELLADEVREGVGSTEVVLDSPGRLTRLDPDFAEVHFVDP